MCCGILIHNSDNRQDFRNVVNFSKLLPVLSRIVVVCLLCLCGFPFSSGFFSKDIILDGAHLGLIFVFFLCGVVLTFRYSFRFSNYLLNNKTKQRNKLVIVYSSLPYILIPIVGLGAFALVSGFYWSESIWLFSGLMVVRWGWKLTYWLAIFSISLFTVFLFNKYVVFLKKYFFSHMWFLNELFSLISFKIFFYYTKITNKRIDQG
jgi:NADH:ubiquinone oxidoreductase subunit 5 (subunit L)/multisubunit Na+/H+ antiporter MnhA subunit